MHNSDPANLFLIKFTRKCVHLFSDMFKTIPNNFPLYSNTTHNQNIYWKKDG